MSKTEVYEYVIPEWAVAPLIYNDYSGLNQDECDKLDRFIDDEKVWFVPPDGEPYFAHKNDIDHYGDMVYTVKGIKV